MRSAIPIVGVVGRSNTGKTTVLESLIPELQKRGYRIAVAKHLNEDVELDQPGKDSWRLAHAGADAVVIGSPRKTAMIRPCDKDASLDELGRLVGADFDLLLVEGYKLEKGPKIEVRRGPSAAEALTPPEDLLAVVGEGPAADNVPRFTPRDTRGLADLIEQKFLTRRGNSVGVWVNDRVVPLNPFVKEFVVRTVIGMVSALKGVKGIGKLDIRVKLTE